jgi:hypothetical protein
MSLQCHAIKLNTGSPCPKHNTLQALQTERREVLLVRLRALDELDAGRRQARWQDSRIGALRALRARERLRDLDEQLARLDSELAEVAR